MEDKNDADPLVNLAGVLTILSAMINFVLFSILPRMDLLVVYSIVILLTTLSDIQHSRIRAIIYTSLESFCFSFVILVSILAKFTELKHLIYFAHISSAFAISAFVMIMCFIYNLSRNQSG